MEGGIINKSENPFAQKSWIDQGYGLTLKRQNQLKIIFGKNFSQIKSIKINDGSYPAFVGIRWGFAKLNKNTLEPTSKWHDIDNYSEYGERLSEKRRLPLVESWDDILENIKTLESYRTSKSDDTLKFYNDLIKRGTCFLVNKINNQISFSPSRFVGYLNNNREKHISNRSKDGRITNPKIEYILNEKFRIDEGLERDYRIFCFSLGFQPQEKGSFGVIRKYLPKGIFPYIPKDFLMDDIDEIQNQENLAETEKQQLVNARLGQGIFRESLFKLWKGCSVTGCNEPTMLRASHIKPWRLCDNRERLDPYNGLLLVPNLDLAFDNGLISFDHDGNIILSTSLNEVDAELLGISKYMRILVSSKHKSYLKYHRENIFKQ